MANIVITNVDNGSVVLERGQTQHDATFTAAGAGTLLAGTILAVDSVSSKYVVFEKGGTTNENGIPKAVITYDVVAAGAGDLTVDVQVSGKFRLERMVIDADGDSSNIDQAVKDQLRDYGLIAVPVRDLSALDNQ